MRFLHMSDLHFGKKLLERDLTADTAFSVEYMIEKAASERVDAIFISGDIYDKSVPSAEAVSYVDEFLSHIKSTNIKTYIIAGNHDSQERLSYCAGMLEEFNIHIITKPRLKIKRYEVCDEYGSVNIYMLPFVKASVVRNLLETSGKAEEAEKIKTVADAVKCLIKNTNIDYSARNILLTHQLIAGASTCDSEEIFVGGTGAVPSDIFAGFDYVALGHLHGPQKVSKNYIRYSGSPLKYSFSEVAHKKTAVLAEMSEKGCIEINTIPYKTLCDMSEIKGSLSDILVAPATDDYLRVILTDSIPPINSVSLLREKFKNLLQVSLENDSSEESGALIPDISQKDFESKSVMDLFCDFYELQSGSKPSKEQEKILEEFLRRDMQ